MSYKQVNVHFDNYEPIFLDRYISDAACRFWLRKYQRHINRHAAHQEAEVKS